MLRTTKATSAASKERSQQAIDSLGGSDTQEAIRANPVSKSAAQNLDGSRAAAA